MKCITKAWDQYENELRYFLYSRVSDHSIAEDLLQDVFVKALIKRDDFCNLSNTRAWLFRVTKNRLIDYHRTHKNHDEVDEQYPEITSEGGDSPVVHLSKCLPTALKHLSNDDREIINQCDLEGVSQANFAKLNNLSLVATKSRIQRARKRLKQELHTACKIVLDDMGNVCCFDPKCK